MTLSELKLRMGRDNFMKISDKCLARGISLLGLVCGIMLLMRCLRSTGSNSIRGTVWDNPCDNPLKCIFHIVIDKGYDFDLHINWYTYNNTIST